MSHGGARPGAGRKRLAPEAKKVSVTISVSGDVARKLRELRGNGYPINQVLETIIHKCHRAKSLCRIERLDVYHDGILSQASFEDFGYPD